MAFHQPLLPVLPVARELLSKTKWIASSSKAPPQIDYKGPPPKLPRAKVLSVDDDTKLDLIQSKAPHRGWRKGSGRRPEAAPPSLTTVSLTDEPESLAVDEIPTRTNSRKRLKTLFTRGPSKSNSMSVSDDN